jgi:hypothetical protein
VLFTETTTRETQSVSFDGSEDSIQVPLGTYDIALQFGAADPRANSLATVRRGVEVTGDAGLNLDLQVQEVNGFVTYDGGKVPSASSGDDLLVRFVEITTLETQSISTDDDDYTIQLPSGDLRRADSARRGGAPTQLADDGWALRRGALDGGPAGGL